MCAFTVLAKFSASLLQIHDYIELLKTGIQDGILQVSDGLVRVKSVQQHCSYTSLLFGF